LLQAISYAAMISQWTPDDFLEGLSGSQKEELEEFLNDGFRSQLNKAQRILLVAEAFDYQVLATAEWLGERHGVSISCCRITLTGDTGTGSEYLICSQILPAPELEEHAVSRRPTGQGVKKPVKTWEEALKATTNKALICFYEAKMKEGQPRGAPGYLHFRVGGRTRWYLGVRSSFCYAWQSGRFEGDEELWRSGLSRPESVKAVFETMATRCLRFHLVTAEDFDFFESTCEQRGSGFVWEETRNDEAAMPGDRTETARGTGGGQ